MRRRRTMSICLALTFLALAGLAPSAAAPADGEVQDRPARRYSLGGAFGIQGMKLHTLFIGDPGPDGYRPIRYGSEPTVTSVVEGGPADGLLRPGDVIVAVDGHLITTREGGRRFAYPSPGEPVRMTIRRDGREIDVWIEAAEPPPAPETPEVPEAVRPEESPAPEVSPAPAPSLPSPGTPMPDVPTVAALAPVPPTPPERLLPKAWVGFGLRCSDCAIRTTEETGETRWEFSSPPEITSVEPGGPAARAGLRAGDRILEIDGTSLLTEEGGRAFGALEPGRPIRWTIRRDGEDRTLTVTPEERPEAPAPITSRGMFGNVLYEVRGPGRTMITRSGDEQEILIVAGDVTVRLRRSDPEDDAS